MTKNVFVQARANTRPTEWDLGEVNPPAPGKANIVMGGGAEDIVFRIVGTPGTVAFDHDDPIWVKPGAGCPQQHFIDGQIAITDQSSPRSLTIRNANSQAGNLHYQLNFRGADPCDPIIINGGGGIGSGGNP